MQSPPPVMFPPRGTGPIAYHSEAACPHLPSSTIEDHTGKSNLTLIDLNTHQFRAATKAITQPEQIEQVRRSKKGPSFIHNFFNIFTIILSYNLLQ